MNTLVNIQCLQMAKKDMDAAKKACEGVIRLPHGVGGTGIAFDGTHWYCIIGKPPRKCTESAPCVTTTWRLKFSKRCIVLDTMPTSDQFLLFHDKQKCLTLVDSLSDSDLVQMRSMNVNVSGKKIRIVAYDPDKLKFGLQDGSSTSCEAMQVELQRRDSETGRWKIATVILALVLIATAFA